MENSNVKFARKCSLTGEGMNKGWVISDGDDYAKYEEGAVELVERMGYNSIQEAYDDNFVYYTTWEDESDFQYELVDGELEEIV